MKNPLFATAALAILIAASGANAQAEVALESVAGAAGRQGVTPYVAAFFTEFQPTTAFDMLARVPGFAFDGGDSVRGYGGAAGNVLIDGQRPASKNDPLENVLRRIQAGQVERVDIIQGGAPGIDMQGKTVIANVILRKDSGGQWLLAVASSVFQDGRTTPALRFEGSRGLGDGKFEWSILPFRFVDDGAGEGPRTRRDGAGVLLRDSFSDETGGGRGLEAKSGWKGPLAGGRLSLNTSYRFEHYDWSLDEIATFPAPDRLLVIDDFRRTDGEIGGSWERALNARTRLELTALTNRRYTEFSSAFDNGTDDGVFSESGERGETIARGVLRYTLSPTLSVEGGGEAAFNFLDSSTDFVQNGVPVVLPAANVRVEERRGEVFGATTWRPRPGLSLEAGLRVEVSTIRQSGDTNLEKSFTYPKPRLSATWSPTASDQIRLRVEREVGQLDFGDFVSSTAFSTGVVTAGNADLEPSKMWTMEAAYERKFWKDGAVVVTLTHQEITDATDRVPIIGPGYAFDAPGNIGDGAADSLAVSLNLPLGRFGVSGGLLKAKGEWTRSEVTDPTTGETRRMSGQEPFEGEINFSQDLPRYRFQWGVNAFLGFEETYYRFDQIETVELETWYQIYIDYKPTPTFSVRVEAQNLAARDFIRNREVYAGPRDTTALAYTDARPLNFDPFLYVRLRKTFG
ncbi:MAG: outer membrane beta-barrel protein [Caulobacter sp.]|nr:outer membrane beta-barrel protein [Caulobacter sp.]